MQRTRQILLFGLAAWLSVTSGLMAQNEVGGDTAPGLGSGTLPPHLKKGLTFWNDFVHFTHLAQEQMSVQNGQGLLDLSLEPAQLLLVVDELSHYRGKSEAILNRGQLLPGEAGEMARKVDKVIFDARRTLAREPERIQKAIRQLDKGERPRHHSREQLLAAGEYAAPYLLRILESSEPADAPLHPYVQTELVIVGRPVVVPLCEALGQIADASVKQTVAHVLSDIGYTAALPYLKAELEKAELDADTRKALQASFDQIVARTNLSKSTGAAALFLSLAEDYYYRHESLILDPNEPVNAVWSYKAGEGLTFLTVPTPVFHDALAMRAARRALQLNPDMGEALSLWVASNYRRENNLPEGQPDDSYGPPIYGAAMQSAHFYGTLAGPAHLHPALARSLKDSDAELSLDLVRALQETGNTRELTGAGATEQPLVAAMSYPDQRVRYEAAFALSLARPRAAFNGSQRVVPVLAEAVHGPTHQPHALVITTDNTEVLNNAINVLKSVADFKLIQGRQVETQLDEIYRSPWINIVVVQTTPAQARAAVAAVRQHYKIKAAPILILAPNDEIITVTNVLGSLPGIFVANEKSDEAGLTEAVNRAMEYGKGTVLDQEQSEAYAVRALNLLKEIAVEGTDVFRVLDAKSALIAALADERQAVAFGASDVLARFPTQDSQRALADASLSASDRGEEIQVHFLRALAESARFNANQLEELQLNRLHELVESSTGITADAAAAAHGALDQPTARGVKLITK